MLRQILVFIALAFAGVFWAVSNVRYCDDLAGNASTGAAQQTASAGASLPLQ